MVPRMKDPTPQKPTAAELQILQVLWERGPSTVREVHDALQEEKALGYTTVLKLMQIMTAHVYEAQQPAEKTKRQFAADMLERVFDGSARELMLHALAVQRSSRQEIEELRNLLDEHERNLR
jgi:BlaI family transcriptional regulator, penicillinase repressor